MTNIRIKKGKRMCKNPDINKNHPHIHKANKTKTVTKTEQNHKYVDNFQLAFTCPPHPLTNSVFLLF